MPDPTPFDTFGMLELLGHRVVYGRLSEATIAGAGFIRIDVPGQEAGSTVATQWYAPGSVYGITPMSEADVRTVLARQRPATVPMLGAPALGRGHDVDEYGNRYDEEPEEEDDYPEAP